MLLQHVKISQYWNKYCSKFLCLVLGNIILNSKGGEVMLRLFIVVLGIGAPLGN